MIGSISLFLKRRIKYGEHPIPLSLTQLIADSNLSVTPSSFFTASRASSSLVTSPYFTRIKRHINGRKRQAQRSTAVSNYHLQTSQNNIYVHITFSNFKYKILQQRNHSLTFLSIDCEYWIRKQHQVKRSKHNSSNRIVKIPPEVSSVLKLYSLRLIDFRTLLIKYYVQ